MDFDMIIENQNMVKVKFHYVDISSFIVHVKTKEIYKDVPKDAEKRHLKF